MQLILKIGIFIALISSSLLGHSQTGADRLYNSLSGEEGITSLSFSKSILEPFEIFIDEDTQKVIYKMEKVRFMYYNKDKGDISSMKVHKRMVDNLSGKGYFKIDTDDIECNNFDIEFDEDEDVQLFGHGRKTQMDEFHILVYENDDIILFSFYGDITIDDIAACGNFSKSSKNIISF